MIDFGDMLMEMQKSTEDGGNILFVTLGISKCGRSDVFAKTAEGITDRVFSAHKNASAQLRCVDLHNGDVRDLLRNARKVETVDPQTPVRKGGLQSKGFTSGSHCFECMQKAMQSRYRLQKTQHRALEGTLFMSLDVLCSTPFKVILLDMVYVDSDIRELDPLARQEKEAASSLQNIFVESIMQRENQVVNVENTQNGAAALLTDAVALVRTGGKIKGGGNHRVFLSVVTPKSGDISRKLLGICANMREVASHRNLPEAPKAKEPPRQPPPSHTLQRRWSIVASQHTMHRERLTTPQQLLLAP